MKKKSLFHILYIRLVCCLIILLLGFGTKFLFPEPFAALSNQYKDVFQQDIDVQKVLNPPADNTIKPTSSDADTVSSQQNKETVTDLSKLSATMKGFDFILPVDYQRISSDFGYRYNPVTGKYALHEGIDFAAKEGDPIVAAQDGIVNKSKFSTDLGYFVQIRHDDGLYTTYCHCSKLLVKEDETVKQGDVIALVGSTGQSTGPHLHFEVKIDNNCLNPVYYLPLKHNA